VIIDHTLFTDVFWFRVLYRSNGKISGKAHLGFLLSSAVQVIGLMFTYITVLWSVIYFVTRFNFYTK